MNKPITVAREDYANAVIKLSNDAPLPAFVKLEVLDKCCEQLRDLVKQEYAKDYKAWVEAQAEPIQHEEGDGT